MMVMVIKILFDHTGRRPTLYAIMAAIAPPSSGGGGYDYRFVKAPSDMFICTVCFLPSKQPYLSECCGHTFCKSCLEGSKKFSNICPMCRSEDFKAIFNKQADRVIRSLHVFCTNKEQGCEWEGEVNDITNHLDNCLFQIIHCPNDCGESLQRQYLTIHVETECPRRRVSCQYCNDVGEYQFIEGQHKEECHKFPIQCPNACKIESICRDEVEEHREICPLEIIQCDYHVVGCKVKMARKDVDTHKQEMMEVHLSLSINELMETKKQLKSAQNNVENTKHDVEKTKDDLTQQLVWHTTKIADTEQQLTANQQEVKKTKEGLTQRMVRVENHLSSTNKQLTVVEQSANNALAQLTTVEILKQQLSASQQETKRTKDRLLQKLTATEKELNTTKQQLATTCQNLTKAEKEHTTLAASTDKALTEMETKFQAKITAAENRMAELERKLQQKTQPKEIPWLTSLHNRASLASGDQVVPVVLKMTEFTKHKGTDWLSKPFYSNCNKECELQLKVFANRIDPTYMSVFLILTNRDKHKPAERLVVRLLNQNSDSEHYLGDTDTSDEVNPFRKFSSFYDRLNSVWYKKSFISYEHLHKNTATQQFLRDDALFFEVQNFKIIYS